MANPTEDMARALASDARVKPIPRTAVGILDVQARKIQFSRLIRANSFLRQIHFSTHVKVFCHHIQISFNGK